MAKRSDRDDDDENEGELGSEQSAQDESGSTSDEDGAEAGAGETSKPAKPTKAKGAAKAVSGKRAGAKGQARFAPPAEPPRAQGGSLGKSLILFLIIIGGLAAAFAILGQDSGGAAPKWKEGQKVEVEITLVSNDIKELACWSPEELNGRHCAFESPTKGWSKGDADEKKLLRPYTTTDRVQFLAAGVWSEPALTASKLPPTRFAVKCSYMVEGRLKKPGIRWNSEGTWLDRNDDWYSGVVSNCRLINP